MNRYAGWTASHKQLYFVTANFKTYINPFFFQQNLNTMNFKTLEKSFPTTTLDYSEFPELQELFPTALGDNELPDF